MENTTAGQRDLRLAGLLRPSSDNRGLLFSYLFLVLTNFQSYWKQAGVFLERMTVDLASGEQAAGLSRAWGLRQCLGPSALTWTPLPCAGLRKQILSLSPPPDLKCDRTFGSSLFPLVRLFTEDKMDAAFLVFCFENLPSVLKFLLM